MVQVRSPQSSRPGEVCLTQHCDFIPRLEIARSGMPGLGIIEIESAERPRMPSVEAVDPAPTAEGALAGPSAAFRLICVTMAVKVSLAITYFTVPGLAKATRPPEVISRDCQTGGALTTSPRRPVEAQTVNAKISQVEIRSHFGCITQHSYPRWPGIAFTQLRGFCNGAGEGCATRAIRQADLSSGFFRTTGKHPCHPVPRIMRSLPGLFPSQRRLAFGGFIVALQVRFHLLKLFPGMLQVTFIPGAISRLVVRIWSVRLHVLLS